MTLTLSPTLSQVVDSSIIAKAHAATRTLTPRLTLTLTLRLPLSLTPRLTLSLTLRLTLSLSLSLSLTRARARSPVGRVLSRVFRRRNEPADEA